MRTRWFLFFAIITLGCTIGCKFDLSGQNRSFSQFNILLLSIDGMRPGHMSLNGYGRKTTPAIDAFAGQSVVFDQAWAPSPDVGVSTYSIMTGVYPATHRAGTPGTTLSPQIKTLNEILSGAHYRTGWMASMYEKALDVSGGFGRAADEIQSFGLDAYSLKFVSFWLENHVKQRFFAFVSDSFSMKFPYLPSSKALSELDPTYRGGGDGSTLGDYPHFLKRVEQESHLSPSNPGFYSAMSKEYLRQVGFDSAKGKEELSFFYDGDLRGADDLFAALIQRLKDLDLYDKTIIVLTSNQMPPLYEHGGLEGNPLYQERLHVPLVIRIPGVPARRVQARVGLIDVFPTLLALAGADVPPGTEGVSLLPWITGDQKKEGDEPHRDLVAQVGPAGYSIQSKDWKLIQFEGQSSDFYHISEDPNELHNLISAPAEAPLQEEMEKRLKIFLSDHRGKG